MTRERLLSVIAQGLFCKVTKMLCVDNFEAIWRDWRLPDWWKQPDCSHHLQDKSRGGTGESLTSWPKYIPWVSNGDMFFFSSFWNEVLYDTQLNIFVVVYIFVKPVTVTILDTHYLSLTMFSPSAICVSSTCRRLYMEWGWTTRVYAWPGISPLRLSVLRMLMRQNQRRTRFVSICHFSYTFFLFIDALKVGDQFWSWSGSSHFFVVLICNVVCLEYLCSTIISVNHIKCLFLVVLHLQNTRGSYYTWQWRLSSHGRIDLPLFFWNRPSQTHN